jgi:hypothetical protein
MKGIFDDFMRSSPVYESFEEFLIKSGIQKSVVYQARD